MAIGINDLDFNEDDFGITPEENAQHQQLPLDDEGEEIKPWMDGIPSEYPPVNTPQDNPPQSKDSEEEDIYAYSLGCYNKIVQDGWKMDY